MSLSIYIHVVYIQCKQILYTTYSKMIEMEAEAEQRKEPERVPAQDQKAAEKTVLTK